MKIHQGRCAFLNVLVTISLSPVLMSQSAVAADDPDCGFSKTTMSFAGSALEQAKCLLRPVNKGGSLGSPLKTLPHPLETIIGTSAEINGERLDAFIKQSGISGDAVGGNIKTPLSQTTSGMGARYFVIHDTSLCVGKEQWPESDNPDKSWNRESRWAENGEAHLFITRDGKLIAPQGRTFATPWRATKLESAVGVAARGLFLHVENVQLRAAEVKSGESTKKADGDCVNDRLAQAPGLTEIQYSRLALAYIAASYRAKQWLVPAYHVAIDKRLSDGHDDPQNFDLAKWSSVICADLQKLGSQCQ